MSEKKNSYTSTLEHLSKAQRQPLQAPGTLLPSMHLEKARQEFTYWFGQAEQSFAFFQVALPQKYYREAALWLHQTIESYYTALLLVCTDYRLEANDLEELEALATQFDPALKTVFPTRMEKEVHHFALLKRACREATSSEAEIIPPEALYALSQRVLLLRVFTQKHCQEEIQRLTEATSRAL